MPSPEASGKKRRHRTTSFVVDVRTPRHSSVLSRLLNDDSQCFSLILVCYQQSTLWRSLGPMIYLDESSPHEMSNKTSGRRRHYNNRISSRLLETIFQNSLQSTSTSKSFSLSSPLCAIKRAIEESATLHTGVEDSLGEENRDSRNDVVHSENLSVDFYHRKVNASLDCLRTVLDESESHQESVQMRLYILPSLITRHQLTFNRLILGHERTMLTKQSLSAWMATLGGGYFFIRRLSFSLVLARQQRVLALQIGNKSMARTCLLNEAYNLIYAGRFREGKMTLKRLQDEVHVGRDKGEIEDDDATITLNQCLAARLLSRRLKKMSNKLQKYHIDNANENHTKDDFQRLRIVAQES